MPATRSGLATARWCYHSVFRFEARQARTPAHRGRRADRPRRVVEGATRPRPVNRAVASNTNGCNIILVMLDEVALRNPIESLEHDKLVRMLANGRALGVIEYGAHDALGSQPIKADLRRGRGPRAPSVTANHVTGKNRSALLPAPPTRSMTNHHERGINKVAPIARTSRSICTYQA